MTKIRYEGEFFIVKIRWLVYTFLVNNFYIQIDTRKRYRFFCNLMAISELIPSLSLSHSCNCNFQFPTKRVILAFACVSIYYIFRCADAILTIWMNQKRQSKKNRTWSVKNKKEGKTTQGVDSHFRMYRFFTTGRPTLRVAAAMNFQATLKKRKKRWKTIKEFAQDFESRGPTMLLFILISGLSHQFRMIYNDTIMIDPCRTHKEKKNRN